MGCYYIIDNATSQSITCTTPSGSGCHSLSALSGHPFVGATGEVIAESNQSGGLADFGSVTVDYLAEDYQGNWIDWYGTTPTTITMAEQVSPYATIESASLNTNSWTATMTWERAN